MTSWLTAEQAAERLGVKPATLYAYVSRGVLIRRRSGDGRSLFEASEVEQLARRGRPRRTGGAPELIIESAVTALGENRQYYRGRDAVELAGWCELEDIADWLWTGDESALTKPDRDPWIVVQQRRDRHKWTASERAVAAGVLAQQGLPEDVLPLERLQVITPVLAAYDPLRLTPNEAVVPDIGRSLIAGMIDCLPGEPVFGPLAGRLWVKLTPAMPDEWLDVLRAALVLLADHELAASTVAVRVAASVRADPYAVVSCGLGATSGALHGGASLGAEALLAEIAKPNQAAHVIGQRLRRGERIPGFGHKVYQAGDGRADALLDRIRAAAPKRHPRIAVAEAVLAEASRRKLPAANVGFALATLVNASGMRPGSGEAIFAIARTVGWLAHAIEEYAKPMRLRLRASYVGTPAPVAGVDQLA